MKVNFPFLLSVHQVAEELFIIQQAIFVFVIRVNDGLGGDRHLFNQQVCGDSQHINERIDSIRFDYDYYYLDLAIRRQDPVLLHFVMEFRHRYESIIVLVQFGK